MLYLACLLRSAREKYRQNARKYHTYPEQPCDQVNFVYYMDIYGTYRSETSKFSIRFESFTNSGHVN